MKTNVKMDKEISLIELIGSSLNDNLLNIASSGFEEFNECYFIETLFSVNTNVTEDDFIDKTGYECFINSVNVDDFVDYDFLKQGLLFIKTIFKYWEMSNISLELEAILIMDEFGLKIKVHTVRIGENYLSDKLNDFEEAILIVKSSEEIKLLGSDLSLPN